MAKILAISSQTVFGPVGLSAAVPALQSQGHEVLALPTIILSHHPGHGKPAGQRTTAALLQDMLNAMQSMGALDNIDAVLTGYFADESQVRVVAETLQKLKPSHILIDPVIGDHGALYVAEAVGEAIRDQLLPLATIITPNLFELLWLSKRADVESAVDVLGIAETLVTSVPGGEDRLETLLFTPTGNHTHSATRLAHVPHGTGDMLAGLYLAHRITQPPATAFAQAMAGLEHVIAASDGLASLQVAKLGTIA